MFELDVTKKNPMVSFIIGSAVAYFTYYLLYVVKRPVLACSSAFHDFLWEHMPIVRDKFWPTFWCFETRTQTILRSLYKSFPKVPYDKELLTTPDCGVIALDWVENDNSVYADRNSRPTVLILPGLTGSSQESYALHFVLEATKKGYRSVVFNNRGNGGADLQTPRTYNASNTEDMNLVVNHIKSRYPDAPILGVGVSLGGLILTNYLAKTGRDCRMVAAMSVSAAWNPFESFKTLEEPVNKFLFNRLLTSNLVENVRKYEDMFQKSGQFDLKSVYKSRTIREFDDRFTAKQFGYPSYIEYYKDATIHNKVDMVEVPLLCLNAADDVFSPMHAIPVEAARKSRYVSIMITHHGGHIGFLEGINPRHQSYMDRVFAQYVEAVFSHYDELVSVL